MKKQTLKTLCLASDVTPAAASAAASAALRAGATEVCTTLAGMLDYLDEPLKSKFLGIKNQINTTLAGLPLTDAVPAANASNNVLSDLLGLFMRSQDMLAHLNGIAKDTGTQLQTTRASMTEEVNKQVAAGVQLALNSGTHILKADLDAKVAEAVVAEKAKWALSQKTVSERRLALASASLPVPGDELLVGEVADFDAKKVTATARIEKLKGFTIPAEKVTQLAWNTDEAGFTSALELLNLGGAGKTAAPAAAAAAKGANGFINGQAANGRDLKKLGAI
jgi:hypothetical protein